MIGIESLKARIPDVDSLTEEEAKFAVEYYCGKDDGIVAGMRDRCKMSYKTILGMWEWFGW